MSFFLSPAKAGKVIWGVGPIVSVPSATGKVLGTGKLSVGPSVVVLSVRGPWVVGTLFKNPISVAGKDDRKKVNQMLIQPFVNYNMKKGRYLAPLRSLRLPGSAIRTIVWTVPIGGGRWTNLTTRQTASEPTGPGRLQRHRELVVATAVSAAFPAEASDPQVAIAERTSAWLCSGNRFCGREDGATESKSIARISR